MGGRGPPSTQRAPCVGTGNDSGSGSAGGGLGGKSAGRRRKQNASIAAVPAPCDGDHHPPAADTGAPSYSFLYCLEMIAEAKNLTGDALATVIVSHTPAYLRSGSRTLCTHNIIAMPQSDSKRSRPKYWENGPDGSWKWTQRAPGEARWIKNHIKGVLFQKQKAESALSFAESAIQAASARYSETKSRDDLHSLTQATADFQFKATNLEWELQKIEDLQKGWVTLDKNYESRWLTTDERDASALTGCISH